MSLREITVFLWKVRNANIMNLEGHQTIQICFSVCLGVRDLGNVSLSLLYLLFEVVVLVLGVLHSCHQSFVIVHQFVEVRLQPSQLVLNCHVFLYFDLEFVHNMHWVIRKSYMRIWWRFINSALSLTVIHNKLQKAL